MNMKEKQYLAFCARFYKGDAEKRHGLLSVQTQVEKWKRVTGPFESWRKWPAARDAQSSLLRLTKGK